MTAKSLSFSLSTVGEELLCLSSGILEAELVVVVVRPKRRASLSMRSQQAAVLDLRAWL